MARRAPLRIGPVTIDEAELRTFYQGLRARGQLEPVLNTLRVFAATAERRLRLLLRKKLLTDPTVAAQFQQQQGRLDALAEVLVAVDRWSEAPKETPTRPGP